MAEFFQHDRSINAAYLARASYVDKSFVVALCLRSQFGPDRDLTERVAAHFLAEINAIHPFREGNGRVQLSFLTLLAEHAGHPLDLEKLDPQAILDATIASFGGSEAPLSKLIGDLAQ